MSHERRVVGVVELVPLMGQLAGGERRRGAASHVAGRLVRDVAHVPRIGGGGRGDRDVVEIGYRDRARGRGGSHRAEQREGEGDQRRKPSAAPKTPSSAGIRVAAARDGRADEATTNGDVSPGHRALLGLRRSHADVGDPVHTPNARPAVRGSRHPSAGESAAPRRSGSDAAPAGRSEDSAFPRWSGCRTGPLSQDVWSRAEIRPHPATSSSPRPRTAMPARAPAPRSRTAPPRGVGPGRGRVSPGTRIGSPRPSATAKAARALRRSGCGRRPRRA